MELVEKTLVRHDIYSGRILQMHVDYVELADGQPGTRECVDHPGGVCVAAITPEKEMLFVKQYRYPYREVCLEIPAGKLEKDEDPFDAVKRELREETGYRGRSWQFCGHMYPSPGYTDELLRMYLCRVEDEDAGEQELDPDEFIEVEKIPIADAIEMVMNNELPDAKTQIMVLKAARILEQEQ